MAPFNPDVPTRNDPNYLGYSKGPISNMEPDKSKGILYETLGNAFKGLVDTADTFVAGKAKNEARGAFEEIQSNQIAGLEAGLGATTTNGETYPTDGGGSSGPSANTSPTSSYAQEPETSEMKLIPGAKIGLPGVGTVGTEGGTDYNNPPPELQTEMKGLAALQQGRVTRADFSTYYSGAAYSKLKDLRSRYVGYEDVIDAQASKTLGFNPANKYVADLTALAVAASSNKDAERAKQLEHVRTSEFIDNRKLVARRIMTPDTWEYNNPTYAVIYYENKNRQAHIELQKQNEKNEVDMKQRTVDTQQNYDAGMRIARDLREGTLQELKAQGVSDESIKNELGPITKEEAERRAQTARLLATSLASNIRSKLLGSSTGKILADKVEEIVKGNTQDLFDIAEQYSKGNTDLATNLTRQMMATTEKDQAWLMGAGNPSNKHYRISLALAGGGPAMAPLIGAINNDIIAGKGGAKATINAFGRDRKAALFDGSATISSIFSDMNKAGVGDPNKRGPGVEGDKVAYTPFYTEVPDMIANPAYPAPERAKLAQQVFNGEVTSQFKDDYVENGRKVAGKYTVLASMTKREISNSVWKLAGSNPQAPLWLQYKSWVSNETNKLYSEQFNAIRQMGEQAGVQYAWDSDNHRLLVNFSPEYYRRNQDPSGNVYMPEGMAFEPAPEQSKDIQMSVDKFNTTTSPLIAIAQTEGVDPNAYVLSKLRGYGINPITKAVAGPGVFEKGAPPEAGPPVLTTTPGKAKAPGKRSEGASEASGKLTSALFFGDETPATLSGGNTPGAEFMTDVSARRTRTASRGTGTTVDADGNPVAAKPMGNISTGVLNRDKFRAELDANPKLRERALAISLAENLHPHANLSVFETAMNRADYRGTTLAKALTLTGENSKSGYYPRAAYSLLKDPKYRALAERNLETALQGSNMSDFATDNASSWLAAKNKRTGNFEFKKDYGDESFFAPRKYRRAQYEQWLNKVRQPGNSNLMAGG